MLTVTSGLERIFMVAVHFFFVIFVDSYFVILCIVHISVLVDLQSSVQSSVLHFLIIYFFKILPHLGLLLLILCGDVEINPGPPNVPRNCRILYSNIRGLFKNKKELDIASTNFDILLCSETIVSDMRHLSELLVPGFKKPFLIKRQAIPRARGMALYVREGLSATHRPLFECGCHEMQVVKISGRLVNLYIFSCYRNPDLDDSIYDCLLDRMAAVQEADVKACFVFAGDFNAHHVEWLNSVSATDNHGVAALDFSTISGCEQLVNVPTHRSGNPLDLVFTDVPGIVSCRVNPPLGSSDHCTLKINAELNQIVPDVTYSRKVYLKSRADWPGIQQDLSELDWGNLYKDPNVIENLNIHLARIIDRRIPSRILKSRLKDKPWFNAECKLVYQEKQEAYNLWRNNRSQFLWDNFVYSRRHAQQIYERVEKEYNDSVKEILLSCGDDHRWWATFKSSLLGVESGLPPLLRSDGTSIYSPKEKAELLSEVFKSKQCGEPLALPPSCSPKPELTSMAFRSKEVKALLLDLDNYGGIDPNGLFPVFFKKTADFIAPKLATIFRKLVRLASFPSIWRTGNIAALPKGFSPSSFPSEYRPISITPILSKVFERLLSKRLSRYVEQKRLLPSLQFGFRRGLGTCDALLTISTYLQKALDVGSEVRMVGLDFSAAFDRVNHVALVHKLKLLGVGGAFINILEEFLLDRTQRVCIDGQFSSFSNVVSGVPQGSVLGPLLFIIYTSDMWKGLENKLVAYADDATLLATVPSPHARSNVAESINRDLNRINEWCRVWGMKLNPAKTQSMIVGRSRTLVPSHPDLIIDGTVVSNSDCFKILGVTFDKKLTFEKHIRGIATSVSRKLGMLRKSFRIFGDEAIILKCFNSFLLPCLEYCSPVWSSAAQSHLRLLDRVVSSVRFLLPNLHIDLWHRRKVSSLCLLHKIYYNSLHPLHSSLPDLEVFLRHTRRAAAANRLSFVSIRFNTDQFARSFLLATTKLWNLLPSEVVESSDLQKFKRSANSFMIRNVC